MTFQDFEKQIDPTILKRGKDYFENGNIEFLEEMNKGYWVANVSGTEEYNVEIQLGNKNSIKNYTCDCPYDGDICKHIVAVIYAISEESILDVTPKTAVKKTPKLSFDGLLKKIELKEYQDFIKYYLQVNKSFKDEFELYFSQKDESFDLEKKYEEVIKKTIKKHTSRGYIDYSASNKLGKELNQFLDTAKQYSSKSNFRDATVIYQILIKEVSKVFEYCDDSNGYVADCVEVAIDELTEMINAPVSFEFKESITSFLKEELQKKIYFDYGDFGYNLIDTYQAFCITTNQTALFMEFIDAKIKGAKSYDYDRKFFIQTKISFLSKIGKEQGVQDLIQENLEISEIRALEVEKSIKKGDYETAKKLIYDGIKIAETKNHSGTVYSWEKELLRIAVLEKDVTLERFLSRKFALGHNLDSNYYNQWKNTYSKDEWESVIEEVISGIDKKINDTVIKNVFYREIHLYSNLLNHLGPIYIQENYLDRLLALVQKQENLNTILMYYSNLKKQYSKELLDILIPVLEKEGDKSEGRSQYKELAKKIYSISKDHPNDKERILDVVRKLKAKYPRRPAMLEELNKLF